MALLPDQLDLLCRMAEGARAVPRTQQEFILVCAPTMGSGALGACTIEGPGLLRTRVMGADVWGLADAGYMNGTQLNQHVSHFVLTAEGFQLYEETRGRPADPVMAMEEETVSYIDAEAFRTRYPGAHEKLRAATDLLWRTAPGDDLTTIGHLLRESLQRFTTRLVELHQPPDVESNPDRTTARLRAVVRMHSGELGDRRSGLLDGIVSYQAAVNLVVQRLEHADQKAGDPPTWEDARSACFQSVNLMSEVDRILSELAH
jgi:hypothetical protein